jgi:TrmH family RNA methyltransferase
MLSKKVIKDIQSLGLKKSREQTGKFIAEGPKIVNEIIALIPGQIESVYSTKEWKAEHEVKEIPFHEVTDEELQRISQLQNAHSVLAVLKQFVQHEPEVQESFCLYLDAIQDPGNFGTLIRICDWFGIKNIICNEGCADFYNPKVVQSSMGSIIRVQVWYDNKNEWLKKQKTKIIAATLAGRSVYNFEKTKTGVLIIGNESRGLNDGLLGLTTDQVTIPRLGGAESLNAAVATGIIFSHLLSQ